MEPSALAVERIFTEEEAARFLHGRRRRRWAVRMTAGVVAVLACTLGPPVFQHFGTQLWLTLLGAQVHWDWNDDNWTGGGATSVWFPVSFRSNSAFGNAGVARLRHLRRLEALDLSNAFDVSAVGLADLKRLPDLKDLDLDRVEDKSSAVTAPPPKFADDDLVHLEPLTGLRSLNLAGNRVTDHGLAHLAALKNLEYLNLDETAVTAAGAQALNQALPDLVIHRNREYEVE
jgi:hypothetical protein